LAFSTGCSLSGAQGKGKRERISHFPVGHPLDFAIKYKIQGEWQKPENPKSAYKNQFGPKKVFSFSSVAFFLLQRRPIIFQPDAFSGGRGRRIGSRLASAATC